METGRCSKTSFSYGKLDNVIDNSVDLKTEENFCLGIQTTINEAKSEGEISVSYQISNAFLIISILSQPRLNETDAKTICCIFDEEFIKKNLKRARRVALV